MAFSSVPKILRGGGGGCGNAGSYFRRASVGSRMGRTTLTKAESDETRRATSSWRRRSFSSTSSGSDGGDGGGGGGGGSQKQQQQRRRLIPTRHSTKRPPPVCRDAAELRERTAELLESPVGSLFCRRDGAGGGVVPTSSSKTDDRDAAYELARESGELVEYLLRGHGRAISPLTLSGGGGGASAEAASKEADPVGASESLEAMMDVMDRFHREGEMYLRLRREALEYGGSNDTDADAAGSESSSSSGSSSTSSSSSSDDDAVAGAGEPGDGFSSSALDDFAETDDPRFSFAVEDKRKVDAQERLGVVAKDDDDFAVPGVTTAMYDTVLDAMACATQVLIEAEGGATTRSPPKGGSSEASSSSSSSFLEALAPDDLYRVAGAAWKAHDLNNRHNNVLGGGGTFFHPTIPTMVTYNATLRGIANLCGSTASIGGGDAVEVGVEKAVVIDQALARGFAAYNHLTHNDHGLPKRNAASIVYLLEIIGACIPTSRTRGNMTVALWHQASREGLVTTDLIRTIRRLHDESNGPEFEIFLESLDGCCSSSSDGDGGVITPQRFARFAKKHRHSRFY